MVSKCHTVKDNDLMHKITLPVKGCQFNTNVKCILPSNQLAQYLPFNH